MQPLSQIRHIVCVASGKGGVGKSTTAVNLSVALAAEGCRVGLLDADIYGPSIPLMMGLADARPQISPEKKIVPLSAHGVHCNSIGFLVDGSTAMVWRAPMIVSAFSQILKDTAWPELDYLIVDMPPGTGDIQLSLTQAVQLAGAIVVTTPQDVALLDARRGIEMFNKVGVPLLGVVENMGMHVCSQCGHSEAIFGAGGGDSLSADYGVEVIGRLPLDLRIREHSDAGTPVVASSPDHPVAQAYLELARNMRARMAALEPSPGPEISISDD